MALGIGAALAIGKAGFAIGKNIAARIKRKKAMEGGAADVDPNMQAIKNALTRKRRTLEVGSSRNRADVAKNMKNLTKANIMAGRRGLGAISKAISDTESNIAREEGAMSQALSEQEGKVAQAISDRKMDLVEADKYQKMQDASAEMQTSGKNIQSSLPGALRKGRKALARKKGKGPSAADGMNLIGSIAKGGVMPGGR